MAKSTSDSILGVIRKFELMLTRRAVNILGGGLRSPSAFLVNCVVKSRITTSSIRRRISAVVLCCQTFSKLVY